MKINSFSLSLVVGFACLGFSDQTLATSVDSVLATDSLAQHESPKPRNHSTERELDHSVNPFPQDAAKRIARLGTEIEQRRAVHDHVSVFDEESTVLFLDAITSIENPQQRDTLLDMTFTSLAEIDLTKTMDYFDGLKLEYQDIVIEAIFSLVKQSDLEMGLEHIDHLSRQHKERAALAFFDSIDYLNYGSLIDIAKLTPYVAVPFIAGIEDRKEQFDLAIELTEYWTKHDVVVASEMTTDYHDFTLDGIMLEAMTKVIAQETPLKALDIVSGYFGPFGAEFEVEVFKTIFESHPDNGLTYVRHLRLDVVDWRVFELSDEIYQISPSIAVEYGIELEGIGREIFFERLIRKFCADEVHVFLSLIEKIPVPLITSRISTCILRNSIREERYFTKDEYDTLSSNILEEDFELIKNINLDTIIK